MRGALGVAALAWCAIAARGYDQYPTFNATLRFRTSVGCHHYGFQCPVPGFSGTDSSPHVDPSTGNVVIGSYDRNIRAINSTDGSVVWAVSGPGGEDSPKVSGDGVVYGWGGLQGKSLQALNSSTGATLWSWEPATSHGVLFGDITTAGAVDEDLEMLYVGTSSSHTFTGVNRTSGKTMWEHDMGDMGEMWGTLGPLGVESDGLAMVCVGVGGSANAHKDCNSSLVCLDKSTGGVVWEAAAGKQIQSRPSQGKESLYVGDYDGCVYAYDVSTGASVWTSCMPVGADGKRGIIEGSSVVGKLRATHNHPFGGEVVIVASWDGHLYGLDASNNGGQLWNTTLGEDWSAGGGAASTPCLSSNGESVYVGGPEGVWGIDTTTGAVLWHYHVGAQCGSSPALTSETNLVIGSEDGWLYSLDFQ